MERLKTVLITFGTKHLKNNIMTKIQEIAKFTLTTGIVVFGTIILLLGFSFILTPFFN
jgi:archaellum biogenesis ATPase FlaH